MSCKPHVMLFAIAMLTAGAVAWAADAPGRAPLPLPPELAPGETPAALAPMQAPDDAGWLADDLLGLDEPEDLAVMGEGPGPAAVGDAEMPGMDRGPGGARGMMPGRMGRGGMGRGACAGMGCGRMGQGMHPGMAGGPGGMGHFGAALDLTDAQKQKLEDIHDRQARRGIQARADIALARMDLARALRADKPEAGAIGTQIDRVAKLRADLAKSHVAAMLEARALLTPDQQKKLGELRSHGPGMGMHGGMRMGEGHPMGSGPGAGTPKGDVR